MYRNIELFCVAAAASLNSNMRPLLRVAFVVLICTAFMSPSRAFAVDPNCQRIADANGKLLNTPFHSFTADSWSSKAMPASTGELIFVGGVLYNHVSIPSLKSDTGWTIDQSSLQNMKEGYEEDKKELGGVSCQHLRDESIVGESASVFFNHHVTDTSVTDGTTWISNSSGRVLRQEISVNLKKEKVTSKSVTRYEYNNVVKPRM